VQYGGYNCGSIPDTGPVAPADSDGDGLADPQDACPYEFGPVENGGCPVPADTDGDGLADPQDACPFEVGPLANNGCPVPADTDGDGLADPQDACPFEAGPLTNNGCPEIGVMASPSLVNLAPALAACRNWCRMRRRFPSTSSFTWRTARRRNLPAITCRGCWKTWSSEIRGLRFQTKTPRPLWISARKSCPP